jgi:hypothetical protein
MGNLVTQDLATDENVNRILQDMCVPIQGCFVRKTVPGGLDSYRAVLIAMFQKKNGLKKGEIVQAWMDAGLTEPNGATYQRVVKEFATHQQSSWILKTGDGAEPN